MSEISRTHLQELAVLQRQANLLWAQILGGQDTPRLRERVMRLEAVQAALLWEAPQMLAACGSCGRAPEALPAA
ncbi:hypothetical protein [Streptomyces sp. NPDC059850]|uniref:hypothetical protein n=1 Tax=Streptomyces sp. NPDC059850 TaxID=3346970 RepID=UPI0036666EFC